MKDGIYLGITNEGSVAVSGYGEKLSFYKGWGKYKKKAHRIAKPGEKYEIIDEMTEKGWKLANICPVKL